MNSIDTFIPILSSLPESEDGIALTSSTTPDAAALEALRALMGGFAPQASAAAPSLKTEAPVKTGALPALLERLLLQADALPPALVALLNHFQGRLQNGGSGAPSDTALVAQMKTLLREVASGTVAPRELGGRGREPLSQAVLPVSQPWTHALPRLSETAPAGFTLEMVPPSPTAVLPGTSAGARLPLSLADGTSPAETAAGAISSPFQAPPPDGAAVSTPAGLPALARALLDALDTPLQANGGLSLPPAAIDSTAAIAFAQYRGPLDITAAASDTGAAIDFARAPDSSQDTQNLGSAILQSLGHPPPQAAPVHGAAPASSAASVATVDRIREVGDLITQMADRVLVSDPLHGQTPEVRIKLADSVMDGTEVRVWREEGGGPLRIEFDTASAYWSRVLNDATAVLAQRLQDRVAGGTEVVVTVQHQQGQPEDGRSRNRQNPWEMAQQAEES